MDGVREALQTASLCFSGFMHLCTFHKVINDRWNIKRCSSVTMCSSCGVKAAAWGGSPLLTRMSLAHRLRAEHEGPVVRREVGGPVHCTVHFVPFKVACDGLNWTKMAEVLEAPEARDVSLYFLSDQDNKDWLCRRV